jgi:hypothetical protein
MFSRLQYKSVTESKNQETNVTKHKEKKIVPQTAVLIIRDGHAI